MTIRAGKIRLTFTLSLFFRRPSFGDEFAISLVAIWHIGQGLEIDVFFLP